MRVDANTKITFNDISKYTGLSKSTISRYFNNPDYLSSDNQEKIRVALKELNYKSNKLASNLAKGKTEFIGIIVPSFYYHFYSYFVNYILNTYQENGYKFIVFISSNSDALEKKCLEELISYQVEGLIILSHNLSSTYLSSLNIPAVTVEREDSHTNSVNTNNFYGAKLAVNKLVADHCEVLIHINSNVAKEIPSYGRIDGFKSSCKASGVKYELFLESFSDSYKETYDLLFNIYLAIKQKYPGIKKGIFMSTDTSANILLNILVQNNEAVPSEYEIIGFDDAPIAEQAIIPLTTIKQNISEMSQCAMQLLNNQIEMKATNTPAQLSHIICQPTLIERNTTENNCLS